jgi:hypothetical protein
MLLELLPGIVEAEEPNHNNYVDWSLPRSVSVTPFEGERYEAEIPDTIDLVDHANYALNQGTCLWAPEWGYEYIYGAFFDINPPKLELGHGGLITEGAKTVETLPMLRVMTGSTYKIDMDDKAILSFVRVTGKDGLCYYPVENRPWAFFEDFTRSVGKPYCDIFAEGRQLLAYASWYQHDRNPLWRTLAERKVRRLMEMTLKKDDTYYFRLSRGYTPWDDPINGPIVPIGDHSLYESKKGMVGTPAAYITGFFPMAGGIWYRLTQDELFRDFSRGQAQYLYRYGELLDPRTGKFMTDHITHTTHSMFSNLSWALTFDDKPMIEWVNKGYEYHILNSDSDQTGIIYGKPTCSCFVADTIGIGIMLSQAGVGNYWEVVDRWIRNTFLDLQLTPADAEQIKRLPVTHLETLEAGFLQPADSADMIVGVWRENLWKEKESSDWSIGCCNGNCSRMLYYIWDNIVTDKDDTLWVNLHLNRASPWADVDSWLPYEGRVLITMKTGKDKLLVRIPEWTDWNEVHCTINGKPLKGIRFKEYLNVGKVKKKDKIVVSFPVKEREVNANLFNMYRRVTLKGNTVIDMVPEVDQAHYPLEKHKKYRANTAPMKKGTRFVSKERFLF